MAVSIANALMTYKNTRVRFTTTIKILEAIKNTYNTDNKETESKLLEDMQKIEVFVIDDIGAEKPTNFVNEKFYSILNNRLINNKITIFTSNLAPEELQLDDRIVNRIEKMAIPIKFPDESIRGYIAKQENEELIIKLLGGTK
jgi:DNA replication protein DnaC